MGRAGGLWGVWRQPRRRQALGLCSPSHARLAPALSLPAGRAPPPPAVTQGPSLLPGLALPLGRQGSRGQIPNFRKSGSCTFIKQTFLLLLTSESSSRVPAGCVAQTTGRPRGAEAGRLERCPAHAPRPTRGVKGSEGCLSLDPRGSTVSTREKVVFTFRRVSSRCDVSGLRDGARKHVTIPLTRR